MSKANAIGCGTGIAVAAALLASVLFAQPQPEATFVSPQFSDNREIVDRGGAWFSVDRGNIENFFDVRNFREASIAPNRGNWLVILKGAGDTTWRLNFKDRGNAEKVVLRLIELHKQARAKP